MVPSRYRLTRRRVVILFLLSIVLSVGIILAVQDTTTGNDLSIKQSQSVKHCRMISSPGTYHITQDIQGGQLAKSCITINASHVTLNGRDHIIIGRGVTDSTAILIQNRMGITDVSVNSVRIRRWNRGVHIVNASQVTVQNVDAWLNAEGVTVWNSSEIKIVGGRLTRNLIGLVVDDSSSQIAVSKAHIEQNQINVDWAYNRSETKTTSNS